ncbi:hypothetical protein DLM_3009 [Aquitalea magnusonii]|uniref:Uncharacterized protein n=1 Tax=Aquitalea magnusonii TaxID=332411 RepID=A0A3G9GIV1_9NEIS|nr:hypothetical protein DLM_3009 [Aquitalea magnusonii]
MRGTGAHLHVEGLHDDAPLLVPIILEGKDDFLEGKHRRGVASKKSKVDSTA